MELEREDPFKQMGRLASDVVFDRKARKKAEEFVLSLVRQGEAQ